MALTRIGNTIYDDSICANEDSECPSYCNHENCMMFSPKKYEAV